MFTKCREYRPTVKEEMPHGTFVFVVNATDKDPPEAGGKVTYSFVTDQKDRPKFKIDPETGNITTSYVSLFLTLLNLVNVMFVSQIIG